MQPIIQISNIKISNLHEKVEINESLQITQY